MKTKKTGFGAGKELNKEEVAEYILSEERTVLSKQRTALAFMQTGLATVGLGLLVVKFWIDYEFRAVGTVLIGLGFYEIARSYIKLAEYNRRLERVKALVKKSRWGRVEYGDYD